MPDIATASFAPGTGKRKPQAPFPEAECAPSALIHIGLGISVVRCAKI